MPFKFNKTDTPSILFRELDEKSYAAEFALLDRYQKFSAELLRLSLLGIGVFGLLFKDTFAPIDWVSASTSLFAASYVSTASVILFGCAAACALAHRFFSSEAARYFLYSLRLHASCPSDTSAAIPCEIQLWMEQREKLLRWCERLKATAAISLALGGITLAATFSILLLAH